MKNTLKSFIMKFININHARKVQQTYNKPVDELHMFDLPDWLYGINNVEIFMNILGDCIATYKPSVPTKKSLHKAFAIIYRTSKYNRGNKENEIMSAYNWAYESVLKDAFKEYLQTDVKIPYGKWMLSSVRIPVFNLKQIVFVDYMLRHPELFVAMKEIKILEIAIKKK